MLTGPVVLDFAGAEGAAAADGGVVALVTLRAGRGLGGLTFRPDLAALGADEPTDPLARALRIVVSSGTVPLLTNSERRR